jgi:hypothetical protein
MDKLQSGKLMLALVSQAFFVPNPAGLTTLVCSLTSLEYFSWLRHCATSRKVAESISDEVIGFFNLPNPSTRTTALGSTQPLTKIRTKNIHGSKGRPAGA